MNSPLFIWNFENDQALIGFLEHFWSKGRDYAILQITENQSLEELKQYSPMGLVNIVCKIATNLDYENLYQGLSKIKELLSEYELQNVKLYILFLFDGNTEVNNLIDSGINLKTKNKFIKGVTIFGNKTSEGYLSEGEVKFNMITFLKLIKYSPTELLSYLGFFNFPSTFRFNSISIPYQSEISFSRNQVYISLIEDNISTLQDEQLKKQIVEVLNSIESSFEISVDKELYSLGYLGSNLEDLYVHNYDAFQKNLIQSFHARLGRINDFITSNKSFLDAVNRQILKIEGSLKGIVEIKHFYKKILEKLNERIQNLSISNSSLHDLESELDNQLKTLLSNTESLNINHRKKLKSFWKNVIMTVIVFSLVFLLDFALFSFSLETKLYIAGLLSILGTFITLFYYLLPIKKLRKKYHLLIKKLYDFSNENYNKLKNAIRINLFNDLTNIITTRMSEFNDCLMLFNEVIGTKVFSELPINISDSFEIVPIRNLITLTNDEISSYRKKFSEIIIECLGKEKSVLQKNLGDIARAIQSLFEVKLKNIKNFWGKNYDEIENIVDERFRKLNSDILLPQIVGYKSKVLKFVIAKPSVKPNILYRKNYAIIDLNNDKDIIWGIWGTLEKAEVSKIPKGIVTISDTDEAIIRTYEWEYLNENYTLTIEIPKLHYESYRLKERILDCKKWSTEYVLNGIDEDIKRIASKLSELNKDKGKEHELNLVLSFVQQIIEYQRDICEYPRYPLETFVDGCGDCEDFSILGATLLKVLGYDVALVIPPKHVGLGIASDGLSGMFLEHQGKKYFYCEMTADGWKIGDIPDDYKNTEISVYPVPAFSVKIDIPASV